MKIAFLEVELMVEFSQSLKQKRHILKGLKDRMRKLFNVSVMECGFQNKWQRSMLCCVFIRSSSSEIDKAVSAIVSFVENYPNVVLVNYEREQVY